MNLKNSKERIRFIKFALVGISGTFIDFAFFNLFSQVFHIYIQIASAISFSLAVINNFYWNRQWTYPESKDELFISKLSQFLIVSVVGLGLNTLILTLLDKPSISLTISLQKNLSFITATNSKVIGDNLSKFFATIVVLFWNYFANRFWTFRDIL